MWFSASAAGPAKRNRLAFVGWRQSFAAVEGQSRNQT